VFLAIAQTKPESSRAIAAVITVFSFPACASLRYRRHSRSWALEQAHHVQAYCEQLNPVASRYHES
jgi:hypothetical protein